jgi:predicted RNA-binding Zn-ribbon protein involved in translation (DUF1610 family)
MRGHGEQGVVRDGARFERGWKVVKSEFAGELEIYLDFAAGQRFGCPECGQLCVVRDMAVIAHLRSQAKWRFSASPASVS